MSVENTSLEESPGMLKAFENAGIVDDVGDNNGGEETQNGTDTATGGSDTGTNTSDQIEGDAGKDSLSSKSDGGKKQGKEEKGKVTDNPGDLKLADGSVVKAGAERRHYEQAQIAKQRLGLIQNELNTVTQQKGTLQTKYDELVSTVSKLGMEKPEDVSAAVTLYKDLSRDPQGTMTKLLAELKAAGYSFEGVGGAIDTAAITNILDARLTKPQQEQGPTKEQIDEQAAKDVQSFMAQFPDAITHEQHIAALIDRSVAIGKPMQLSDAYFALKERVANDGLDWTKPLGPQLEARNQQQQQSNPKPRAGGRGTVDATQIDPSKVIQPEKEMDTDSIVLAAMKENGFNLNR